VCTHKSTSDFIEIMNLNPSKMYERRPSPTKRPTKNTLLPEVETINTIREEGPVAKTFKPPMLVRTEAFDERRGKGQSYRGAKGGKGGKGRTNGAHGSRFDVEKEDWYMRILVLVMVVTCQTRRCVILRMVLLTLSRTSITV